MTFGKSLGKFLMWTGGASLGVAALATGFVTDISDYVSPDVNNIGTAFEYLKNYTLELAEQMTLWSTRDPVVGWSFWGGAGTLLTGARLNLSFTDD